jgi:hypothetical protein
VRQQRASEAADCYLKDAPLFRSRVISDALDGNCAAISHSARLLREGRRAALVKGTRVGWGVLTSSLRTVIEVSMSTYQEDDVTIWVCPHGNSADVIEFPDGGKEPIDQACASNGEPFIKRCPRAGCPDPTYRVKDLDRRYHHCGEGIPWADARSESAKALLEYDTFNSRYLGRVKRADTSAAEEIIRSRSKAQELTPRERQDLIVPPSGRLPAERVRIANEKEPPRITALRGTGRHLSKPDLPPENVEGAIPAELAPRAPDLGRFIDREATKELRGLEKKWAENAKKPPKPARKGEPLWRKGLSGVGKWIFGISITVVGGAILLVIRAYLKGQGYDVP